MAETVTPWSETGSPTKRSEGSSRRSSARRESSWRQRSSMNPCRRSDWAEGGSRISEGSRITSGEWAPAFLISSVRYFRQPAGLPGSTRPVTAAIRIRVSIMIAPFSKREG